MAIYPIAFSKALTLREIAFHWSKKMDSPSSDTDILNEMIGDWWRGKLRDLNGTSRPKMLTILYGNPEGDIVFRLPDQDSPLTVVDLPDGGALVDISTEVPIPDQDPAKWDESNCEAAFQVMAGSWDYLTFRTTGPLLAEMEMSESQFSSWLSDRGTPRPDFWALPTGSDRKRRANKAWPEVRIREWIPKSGISNQKDAVKAFMSQPETDGLRDEFVRTWNAIHKRRRGRPPKKSAPA